MAKRITNEIYDKLLDVNDRSILRGFEKDIAKFFEKRFNNNVSTKNIKDFIPFIISVSKDRIVIDTRQLNEKFYMFEKVDPNDTKCAVVQDVSLARSALNIKIEQLWLTTKSFKIFSFQLGKNKEHVDAIIVRF